MEFTSVYNKFSIQSIQIRLNEIYNNPYPVLNEDMNWKLKQSCFSYCISKLNDDGKLHNGLLWFHNKMLTDFYIKKVLNFMLLHLL